MGEGGEIVGNWELLENFQEHLGATGSNCESLRTTQNCAEAARDNWNPLGATKNTRYGAWCVMCTEIIRVNKDFILLYMAK